MFYSYVEKQGDGFFGSWQLRQVAFDTMRRYLYYSEPTKDAFPIIHQLTDGNTTSATASATDISAAYGGSNAHLSSQASSLSDRPGTAVTAQAASSPSRLVWKKKMKVTAVVPTATRTHFVQKSANERDLYQLEIKGESRQLATGEYPPPGPLLCPSAGFSTLERERCNANNEAFIRDPFFLKELFDSLRDQFDEMTKVKVRAAATAADTGAQDEGAAESVDFGVQTIVSPRKPKADAGVCEAVVPVRVVLRCRDEREFRRLWYVLQTVLGYDKLIVRPYRGLPPYDPRNGVAFAHIPMSVWHTFHSLDKAVFYTFLRGNFYALESAGGGGDDDDAPNSLPRALSSGRGSRAQLRAAPRLKRVLDGGYLCITHDSVLCMRESGNIPRWLRLSEVQDFHWDITARDARTSKAAPFCVFLSDAPTPDLFFEPTAPAFGADAMASYDPLVDMRRIARVIHDTCFASFSTRRVIRIKEVQDASMEAYVAGMVREGRRLPGLQNGNAYNSTLSCPLPKEQLAVVWQQVQSELLERGNMANRAAIPIYRTNARDVDLSEDQLSTVERELDEERERRDDVVGMPLERARQLERRRRAAVQHAHVHRTRPRHRDVRAAGHSGSDSHRLVSTLNNNNGHSATLPPSGSATTTTAAQVMPLTMELLHTPQLQGQFATTVSQLQHHGNGVGQPHHSVSRSSNQSSPVGSTKAASEYSSYLVPGARYLTPEEWHSGGYGAPSSPLAVSESGAAIEASAALPQVLSPAAAPQGGDAASRVPALSGSALASSGGSADRPIMTTQPGGGGGTMCDTFAEERTVNEIVGHSMAALDGSRVDLDQMDSA